MKISPSRVWRIFHAVVKGDLDDAVARRLSLCLVCSTLVSAQSTGGRILGRVADSSGAVLGDVKVTATNEATGIARDTKTNTSGDYVFLELPVGTYALSFDLSGFKTNVRRMWCWT